MLRLATPELRADPEVVLAAVNENGKAMRFADYTLRASKESWGMLQQPGMQSGMTQSGMMQPGMMQPGMLQMTVVVPPGLCGGMPMQVQAPTGPMQVLQPVDSGG